MIIASDIHKSYGQVSILKGISLHIKEGEFVSIVGASGAGKTTLLQILGTLETPDSGILKLDGVEVNSLCEKALSKLRNEKIGFIFQFHHLLPEFTALENVLIPSMIGGRNQKEYTEKAKNLLDFLGLSHRLTHKPSELSGGEQQRVAIARALINEPKIVFADEPTGNLDSKNAQEMHKLFLDLRRQFKQTFVIVTHNEELASIADRKLTMVDGVIQ